MREMKIDVTIATKNNERTIQRVIMAVRACLPYDRIILIDDSSDRTPELAEMLGARVYHVEGNLGMKRIMQARLANTEWIASIDSDVVVYPNIWKEMSVFLNRPDVGSISGFLESAFASIFPEYEEFTKFCARLRLRLTKRLGTMACVFIRREALLNCEDHLRGVHAGEDTIIGKALKGMGFSHVTVTVPVGFHWHEDPIAHHLMAYYRAGESNRSATGASKACLKAIKASLLHVSELVAFSLLKRRLHPRLYIFNYFLWSNYLAGTLGRDTWRKSIPRIGKNRLLLPPGS